jgi:hypothetical protein
MNLADRVPLANTPVSASLRSSCNNRYGAVLSALYGFCSSRQTTGSLSGIPTRTDAYSVITFAKFATVSKYGSFPQKFLIENIVRPAFQMTLQAPPAN